jgi:two-component system cell cycle response regulator
MAGKKLLVADDSLTIQKVIRLALSNEGYEIQAISDGAEAIQQIATFRPDAILVDVSLPTRTAFEIKREVNGMEDCSEMKFILMSSAFEKIDESQANTVGFDGRLTKPFDPAHLRQVLLEVLTAPSKPRLPPPTLPSVEPTKTLRAPQQQQQPQMQVPPPLPPAPESPIFTGAISLEPPKDLPPSDFGDDIWGKHEESEGDDIKHLTESTIRLSGLADFQEPEAQTPPPIPNWKSKESPASQEPPLKDDFDWTVNEPSLKPPSSFGDLEGSSFKMPPLGAGSPKQKLPEQEIDFDSPPPPPSRGASPFTPAPPQKFPADAIEMDSRMEEVIRRQVEETLERLVRQILPEAAERVIKEEINRLLNEKF